MIRRSSLILLISLTTICIFIGSIASYGVVGPGKGPSEGRNPLDVISSSIEAGTFDQLVLDASIDRSMFDISLMIREHADFLLTPALLVQEAISEDVVLTYPEE